MKKGLLIGYIAGMAASCVVFGLYSARTASAHASDPEFMLVIVDARHKPGKNVGVVQVGLNEVQARGAAFQLNEAFRDHRLPVEIKYHSQSDIGNYKPSASSK